MIRKVLILGGSSDIGKETVNYYLKKKLESFLSF